MSRPNCSCILSKGVLGVVIKNVNVPIPCGRISPSCAVAALLRPSSQLLLLYGLVLSIGLDADNLVRPAGKVLLPVFLITVFAYIFESVYLVIFDGSIFWVIALSEYVLN